MPKRKQLTGAVQPQLLKTQKRMRRAKPICSCSSPRFTSGPAFCCYEQDVWTEIAKFLDGKSLVMLAATCRWFHVLVMDGSIWKYLCQRDLQVPAPRHAAFDWKKLYISSFNGSHSYMFRQQEKHIEAQHRVPKTNGFFPVVPTCLNESDWMRIGAFFLESSSALLTERLSPPLKFPKEESIQKMLESCGSCVLNNVKPGIWIADLQLVRCPVCELNTCDGTMQTLDARHIELFLSEGYQDGSWEYELIGIQDVKKHVEGASGAIFDVKHLNDSSPSAVFNLKSWVGKPNDWQPKAVITMHAVAVNTNLQKNEGLQVKYHVMRAGAGGEAVSIRISQQLL